MSNGRYVLQIKLNEEQRTALHAEAKRNCLPAATLGRQLILRGLGIIPQESARRESGADGVPTEKD